MHVYSVDSCDTVFCPGCQQSCPTEEFLHIPTLFKPDDDCSWRHLRVLSPSYALYHLHRLPLATIFVQFKGLSVTPSDDTTSLLKTGRCHFLRILVMNVQFCQDECQRLSIYICSTPAKSQWTEYVLDSILLTSVCEHIWIETDLSGINCV